MDADSGVGAGRTVVVPRGELDLAAVPVLDAVLKAQAGRVVLDLRKLTLVDAAGLQLLIEAEARSSTSGRRLSFIAGPAVARLFDLLGLPDPLTYRQAAYCPGFGGPGVIVPSLRHRDRRYRRLKGRD